MYCHEENLILSGQPCDPLRHMALRIPNTLSDLIRSNCRYNLRSKKLFRTHNNNNIRPHNHHMTISDQISSDKVEEIIASSIFVHCIQVHDNSKKYNNKKE